MRSERVGLRVSGLGFSRARRVLRLEVSVGLKVGGVRTRISFRVPGFLATSGSKNVARSFALNVSQDVGCRM